MLEVWDLKEGSVEAHLLSVLPCINQGISRNDFSLLFQIVGYVELLNNKIVKSDFMWSITVKRHVNLSDVGVYKINETNERKDVFDVPHLPFLFLWKIIEWGIFLFPWAPGSQIPKSLSPAPVVISIFWTSHKSIQWINLCQTDSWW